MQDQTLSSRAERSAGPDDLRLQAEFPGKYLSLTSFKRDGSGVATPVWFVIEDGRLLIQTDGRSFKAKRIRRNPAVMIAPCTATGRMSREPSPARAEFLPDSELDHVGYLLARKYRIDRIVILPVYRALQWLRGARRGAGSVALAITPVARVSSQTLRRSNDEDRVPARIEVRQRSARRSRVPATHGRPRPRRRHTSHS